MTGYVYRGRNRDLGIDLEQANQRILNDRDEIRRQARIRDIPARCACSWGYAPSFSRWFRHQAAAGCPWHTAKQRAA